MLADDAPGRPLGRRAFLGLVGLGLGALVLGRGDSVLPAAVRSVVPGLGGGWRIYSVNPPMPTFDPASWSLRIDGLVERPQTLAYADLLALPRAEQTSDFHCVTGWSVSGVRWAGVRFGYLLARARPLPSAGALVFVSAEIPYVESLTMAQADSPDAMVAYEMDGRPLSREHGAPARAVMPRMYGYKGTKWLARIVVTERALDGYWEQRGYDRDAWIGHSNGLS